jgi:hypothetical protein
MGNMFPKQELKMEMEIKSMSKEEEELVKKKIDDETIGKKMYLIQHPYLISEKNISNLEQEANAKYIRQIGRPMTYNETLHLFHYEELKYGMC